ncbi:mannose-P-dolichol utilization defect 1 protein [Arthroderma uncinatum]|uniref:mannose-P-dolichol utilization defect 1 protein n=1 Tax=Arthroderma uncinatum TaxID=74035 RepID=UPI00144A71EC|nr:mannose-P-dolichol utilization defect 1 protein [Arthroderma uncinatum]KAF3480897.1 mannose-P-dolichol utilization defect 1 protein [Arthroderma uncinatum]
MEALPQFLQSNIITPLQPLLRPITTSLPTPINDALISLLGANCYTSLVLGLDITKDPECFPLAISKILGIAIVVFSAIVKVPQILKLISSRSAAGVSFTSYALETASFLITLAYNARQGFPFSTYGEVALIAVQDIVVSVLVLVFSGQTATAGAFLAAVIGIGYALLFSGESIVDNATMGYLQAGAGLLGIASKLPQIWTIWSQGGIGQLSAFAVFNYLFGSLSRIFTTLQEVDDKLILYGFVAGFSLNVILAAQVIYYWNTPSSTASKKPSSRKQATSGVQIPAAVSSGVSQSPSVKGPSTRRRG